MTVFHAEALARWAQTIGLPILMTLSDSLSLVQALENKIEYQNELSILLSDIRMLLSSFPEAAVGHVSCKVNVTAYNLAKHALQLDDESSWMEEIPHTENYN